MRKRLAIVVLVSLCFGCSWVSSSEPLGQPIQLDPAAWDGVWLPVGSGPEDQIDIRVSDAATGELTLTDADDLECLALVRQAGSWTVVNIEEQNNPGVYLWVVVNMDDDTMIVWLPDVGKFRRLIDDGLLPGEHERGVRLYPLSEDDYDLISSERAGVLLDWQEPMVLQRVARQRARDVEQ